MAKLLYKPVGIIAGLIAGAIASKLFEAAWGSVTDREPADPTHRQAEWPEIVGSAVLQGAIFAGVRAAVDRVGARGFEQATGVWPGDERPDRA